jgi:hypothetical protein
MAMLALEKELEKLTKTARLSNALADVDKIIDLLTKARTEVERGQLATCALVFLPNIFEY